MFFSEEDDKNIELVENHIEKEKKLGYKKYVVNIDVKYTHLIDSISIDERNEIINDVISVYYDEQNEKKQNKKIMKIISMLLISIIFFLFAAPGVFWLVNKSFTLTHKNYLEMQNNFEVLYKNKKR